MAPHNLVSHAIAGQARGELLQQAQHLPLNPGWFSVYEKKEKATPPEAEWLQYIEGSKGLISAHLPAPEGIPGH